MPGISLLLARNLVHLNLQGLFSEYFNTGWRGISVDKFERESRRRLFAIVFLVSTVGTYSRRAG